MWEDRHHSKRDFCALCTHPQDLQACMSFMRNTLSWCASTASLKSQSVKNSSLVPKIPLPGACINTLGKEIHEVQSVSFEIQIKAKIRCCFQNLNGKPSDTAHGFVAFCMETSLARWQLRYEQVWIPSPYPAPLVPTAEAHWQLS